MTSAPNITGKTGLRFFGTMTASISHEIKNVLAIMNENAGLMKDLALMAEKGRPLNIDKIKTISDRFCHQVSRADEIVKNLNQFSHSTDDFDKQVDVGEALTLMLSLANRFISMNNATIEYTPPATACIINTNPFFLHNLLWFGMDYALNHQGPENIISIDCRNKESNVVLLFEGLEGVSKNDTGCFLFSAEGEAVVRYLGATLNVNPQVRSLEICLPQNSKSLLENKGENR